MRMDDYQKWLDDQFMDEGEESVTTAEAEQEGPIAESEEPTITSDDPSTAPAFSEYTAPNPDYVEPRQIIQHSRVQPPAEESALPALDDYIPFLRSRALETVESAPSMPETPLAPIGQAEAPVRPDSDEPALNEPLQPVFTPQAEGQVQQVGKVGIVRPSSAVSERPRARHARPAAPAENIQPLDPDKLWNLVPKHLQVLIAMDSDEVAQNSYKRQFKESRIDLISRLLDPTLSLEDTARVLNVCPTTVRRYTNKGMLTHQRTQGDQRRFKLSDVLAFLEAQSRKES